MANTTKTLKKAHKSAAILDIADERQRQIDKEGWSYEHDETHDAGELARAAAAYANHAAKTPRARGHCPHGSPPLIWPWGKGWWKPTDRRRDLVKAGALIVAEIERLDRKRMLNLAEDIERPERRDWGGRGS